MQLYQMKFQYTKNFAEQNSMMRVQPTAMQTALNQFQAQWNETHRQIHKIDNIEVNQGSPAASMNDYPKNDPLHWGIRIDVDTNQLTNRQRKELNHDLYWFIDGNTRISPIVTTLKLVHGLRLTKCNN